MKSLNCIKAQNNKIWKEYNIEKIIMIAKLDVKLQHQVFK